MLKSWQWRGMPKTVILTGILSIFLLLWTYRISEKMRIFESQADATQRAQTSIVTYHLRLEEVLSARPGADLKEAMAALEQALRQVNVILNGGDEVAEPFKKTAKLRSVAEDINNRLATLNALGLKRLNMPEGSEAGVSLERQFEREFRQVLSKAQALEEIVEKEEAGNQAKSGRLFRGIVVVWALFVGAATVMLWNRETRRKGAEEKLVQANDQLLAQTEELRQHRVHLAELVEKRTSELTTAIQNMRLEMAVRLKAYETLKNQEMQIRHLSSELVTAQEIERRRISMELHDELGQALNVTKLNLRAIERGLPENQGKARKECEELLAYLDDIIENVRRISYDLSPTVLEDLGLAAAVRSLIGNFAKSCSIEASADIAEIDRLIPQNQWITVYRVIQEALTNIGKHAQAGKVTVRVRHRENEVLFSVEDNGKGFAIPPRATGENEKGLGLTTMTERIRLLGGAIDLWSEAGSGTRVAFSIPVQPGESLHG